MTLALPETAVEVLALGPVLVAGLIFGLVAGLTPGISGRIGLLIALPVALWLDPVSAVVFLIAMHSVVHTSGSVPAVLLGLPTSSSEAATVVDGWPMMQSGRGGQAVGAILAASVAGGVLGAVALLALAPLGGAIVRHFTSAEVAAMSAAGLLAIAALSGRSLALGLVVAALGVLAATVGVDTYTAVERFTLGRLELWDGLNIGAIVAGLFVIPGLLTDQREADAKVPGSRQGPSPRVLYADVVAGCWQTLQNGWLVLRASVLGIVIGFIPGLGASVAVWLAYGHASASTTPKVPFGQGAIEGVIAPEAANNSKEGGAMLPTLLFAVPGTTSMGILLGAFALLGIEVGPGMAAQDHGLIALAGWVILAANLLAFPVCLAMAPLLTRMATLHRALVVPFALMASTVAALAISPSIETLVQIVVFGALGSVLAHLDWPRAPFVLGFVIGPILEGALTRTSLTVGLGALQRPMVLVILALAVAAILSSRHSRRTDRSATPPPKGMDGAEPASHPAFLTLLLALFALAMVVAWSLPGQASVMPLLAGALGLAAAGAALVTRRTARRLANIVTPAVLALFVAFLLVIWLAGPPLAAAAFALVYYARFTTLPRRWLVLVAFGFAVAAWALAGETIGLLAPVTALSDLSAGGF